MKTYINGLIALLLVTLAACGPATGSMPEDDAGMTGTDAVVNTDSTPGTDSRPSSCKPSVDSSNVNAYRGNPAYTCTAVGASEMSTECCSGRCSGGLCGPSNLGGLCVTDNDCERDQGICRNGRCSYMDPGSACTSTLNGRRMCYCTNGACECASEGGSCMRNSDCCSGTCHGVGATTPGSCY